MRGTRSRAASDTAAAAAAAAAAVRPPPPPPPAASGTARRSSARSPARPRAPPPPPPPPFPLPQAAALAAPSPFESLPDHLFITLLTALPLDVRCRCSALSKRWRALCGAPSLRAHLSFAGVARPSAVTAPVLAALVDATHRELVSLDLGGVPLLPAEVLAALRPRRALPPTQPRGRGGGGRRRAAAAAAPALPPAPLLRSVIGPSRYFLVPEQLLELRSLAPRLSSLSAIATCRAGRMAEALDALPHHGEVLLHNVQPGGPVDGGGDADAPAAIPQLCASLLTCSTIVVLQLVDCFLGDAEAATLAAVLSPTHPSLRSLFLYKNGVRDDGARSLARMLATNSVLRALDLERNRIGPDGQAALHTAVVSRAVPLDLVLDGQR